MLAEIESLLPAAAEWAEEQQQRIMRDGVPLSIRELADALRVGVQDPERVRLLQVEAIPAPSHPALKAIYQVANFGPAKPRGLTVYYGVFVRSDCWRNRPLIVHELVHTAQYERLGGIEPFLRQYLIECATDGYNKSALESEAVTTAANLIDAAEAVRL